MKTLNLIQPFRLNRFVLRAIAFVILVLTLWFVLPPLLRLGDLTIGLVDAAVWQLLLFSMISYLAFLLLTALIFYWLSGLLGLSLTQHFCSQFKTLSLWQQFGFYWASFALLLLAGVMCMLAVF